MAKLNLYDALSVALTKTKQYIDDNHYNQSEVDALLALKAEKNHGNHVPATEAAQNNKFLRNDNSWAIITPENIGAAPATHGTHVTYSTTTPAAGSNSGSVGTADTVARSDHSHPLQTTVSGNAGSANKVNNSIKVQLNGGTTEGTNQFTFDGSAAKTINITPAGIGASASGHNHDDRYYTESEINTKINTINTAISTAQTAAQTYADNKITSLVNSAPEAMNTLGELAKAIDDHQDVYEAYVEEISTALAGKADKEHGTHLTLGTGSGNAYRGDHGLIAYNHSQAAHAPSNAQKNSDITKAEIEAKLTGTISTHTHAVASTNADGLMTKAMVTKLNGIASGAEVNQNAFANVKVGDTTVAADAKQDTIEFVAGSNITITPDATNDKITIAAKDTVYTHPNSGATAGSYGNSSAQTPGYGATFNVPYITVNAQGHITAISNQTVKIPASDKVTVTDNLTSTSASAALSANQGKVLKGMVDGKADMIEDTVLNTLLSDIFDA